MPGPTGRSGRRASPKFRRRLRCRRRSRLGSLAGDRRRRVHSPRAAKAIRTRTANFYQPFNWRGFYDFGCGALGDMACHILGAPNMALKLGAPTSVECIKKEGVERFHVPQEIGHPVRFPGARQHAAGEDLLVRRAEGTAGDHRECPKANIWATCPAWAAAGADRVAARVRRERPGAPAAGAAPATRPGEPASWATCSIGTMRTCRVSRSPACA